MSVLIFRQLSKFDKRLNKKTNRINRLNPRWRLFEASLIISDFTVSDNLVALLFIQMFNIKHESSSVLQEVLVMV